MFHDPLSLVLLDQVERIARSDATTLIIGETGTGKELIARHIHAQSNRQGPFVAVNCGAFSENLIDAELFGHESGAFTGATQARAGWFETANGGTLFLDEIGDLSLSLQVKLLRVLQERQVIRLGSSTPIALDVRLIAATNVDLPRAIEAEHFRADLYYRLNVASIYLPPLCERIGDIVPLANHFIRMYSAKLGLSDVILSGSAESALLSYEWPGNIRELENAIHSALIVCSDNIIRVNDIKLAGAAHRMSLHRNLVESAIPSPSSYQDPIVSSTPVTPIEVFQKLIRELIEADQKHLFELVEQKLIETAYRACNRNQVKTAKVLGVTRNVIRTHLKNYQIAAEPTASSATSSSYLSKDHVALQ